MILKDNYMFANAGIARDTLVPILIMFSIKNTEGLMTFGLP
jgi:hypothetical protein